MSELVSGKHKFSAQLAKAKNPVIIVGSSALQRADGAVILAKLQDLINNLRSKGQIAPNWRVLNVLHRVASQVAALDLGYCPGAQKLRDAKPKVLYMLGADEGMVTKSDLPNSFIIYQGNFFTSMHNLFV